MENRKEKALIGLKKANSLLSRIIKMTEEDQYCIDIMQQNLAVIGLLRAAHSVLMENHLNVCFKKALLGKDKHKEKEMTEEILKVINLFNK